MNHTFAFAFAVEDGTHFSFTDPGEMKGWVGLGRLVAYIPK